MKRNEIIRETYLSKFCIAIAFFKEKFFLVILHLYMHAFLLKLTDPYLILLYEAIVSHVLFCIVLFYKICIYNNIISEESIKLPIISIFTHVVKVRTVRILIFSYQGLSISPIIFCHETNQNPNYHKTSSAEPLTCYRI